MLGLACAVLILGTSVGAEEKDWQGTELLHSIANDVRLNGSPGKIDADVL